MIKIYAFVTGDLLHIGHLKALEQAKKLGDHLIVGVITDKGVEAYKGVPVIPYAERFELVKNLKPVDEVVEQQTVDPTDNLRKLKPDILVHGDDWGDDFPGAAYMRSIGKEVVRTKYYPFQTTTKIIAEIVGHIRWNIGVGTVRKGKTEGEL